jgi:hypothetical protein
MSSGSTILRSKVERGRLMGPPHTKGDEASHASGERLNMPRSTGRPSVGGSNTLGGNDGDSNASDCPSESIKFREVV